MQFSAQISKHFREVHFGGNWTGVHLQGVLAGVNWQLATTKMEGFNTIAVLVFHIHYYAQALKRVLLGRPIDAHDRFSFDCPPITSEAEWAEFLEKIWQEAEQIAELIAQYPDEKLGETFVSEKYGTYFRNFQGLLEHTHYHLGQIVMIRKMLEKGGMSISPTPNFL